MFSNSQVIVPTWNPNQTDASGSITAVRPAWSYFGEANLIGATTEAGEPNHASANGIASVWYKYTPSTSGEMRIITTNGSTLVAGSTAFAVYTGGLNGSYFPFEGNSLNSMGLAVNSYNSPSYTNDASPDPGSIQSLQLNGSSSYLDVMDSFEPTSYTVSVWVKVPSVRAMGIIGRTTSSGLNSGVWSHDLHITAGGVFEHYTSTGSSGYTVTGTTVVQPNTWYHVAIVASAGGQELLYVNGVSQGTPNSIPSLWAGGDRWQVGTPPPGYNYFNGELDGLAIYHNTVLAPAQIAAVASGSTSPTSYITTALTQITSMGSSTSGYLSVSASAGLNYYLAFTCPGSNVFSYPFGFYYFPPATNDMFANATVIPNTYGATNFSFSQVSGSVPIISYATNGYTLQATAESGEQGGNGTSGSVLGSVWYTFVAPATGYFSVSANCSVNQYLDIGQGSPSNFTNVTSTSMTATPSLSCMLTGGQTYYVRIWTSTSWATWSGLFTMQAVFYPEPANDYWTNRAALPIQTANTVPYSLSYGQFSGTWNQTIYSNSWLVNAYGATKESGEQSGGNSVWYGWTPPSAGSISLSATNSFGGLSFWLETGTAANNYTELGGNNINSTYSSESFSVNVVPTTNYEVIYANWNSREEDAGQITGIFYPQPANDMFAARQTFPTSYRTNYITWQGQTLVLSVDQVASVPGSTLGATVESGEQWSGWPRSIWYSWTPTRPQPFDINTCGSVKPDGVTPLTTFMSVNTGTAVSALSQLWYGQQNIGTWAGTTGLTPTVGTEYEIQVMDEVGGGITLLNWRQYVPQTNDYFSNAIPVTQIKQVFTDGSLLETNLIYGATSNATVETGEPNNTQGSVWYKWTADATGQAYIAMSSSFPGNLFIYTGSAVTSLATIATPYTGADGRSWVSFNAVSNTTYNIQVHSPNGSGGAFSLAFYEYVTPGSTFSGNFGPSTSFTILPTNINTYGESTAILNGNATNFSLPSGTSNALTDLINYGVPLNAYYNTNFNGSNSLWWNYTATSNNELVVYNSALVASVALRTGLGYDANMNPVNLPNPFGENTNVVYTPSGAYFTNTSSATSFTSHPLSSGVFRAELNYMYVANLGTANSIILSSGNGNYAPLAVNNATLQLGTYCLGTFTPFNYTLSLGVDYYIAYECNGAPGNSSYTLWINNVLIGTIVAGFDGNSFSLNSLGAGGGAVHDLRIYSTVPINHEAFEIWQGSSMIAINNDIVMIPCTAGTTYQIRTTQLDGQGTYFPFNGSVQNSLGLMVYSYNNPGFTNDPSPDPGSVQSLLLNGNNTTATLVPGGGFETPSETSYAYGPSGGTWSYGGQSGIIAQGNGFWGSAFSGYGNQFGFVQGAGNCYETLSNMVAGTYNISFFTDSRPGSTPENFNVLIDGSAVGGFTPPCGTSFTAVTTPNFTVTAGNHVLEFQGVSGGAAFLDNVGLNTVTASNLSYYNYLDVMDEFVPTSYTVSAWVKVPVVKAMGIVGRTTAAGISSVLSDDLHITAAGVFEHYTSSGSSGYAVTGTTLIQPDTWYHVAIAASAGGQELLYVNGVSQGTPVTISSLSATGDRWQVGTPPLGYNYFNGELGGLAIYHNTVLTPAQIAALAAGTASPMSFMNFPMQFVVQEFYPMVEYHNIDDPKMLAFTNVVSTWTLPNGTVSSTNYLTGDACYFVEGTWGPEWNPSGLQAPPGGDLWYTFVPPVAGTVTVTDPYSATLSEYLNAFSSYANLLGTSSAARNWNSTSFSANGGQEYWLENGVNGEGTSGVSLLLANPPANDNFANATPIIFATNAIASTLVDGQVTNYTLTANLVGQNYQATVDAGEQSIGNYTGVSTAGHSVWWSFTPYTNGWISIDPTLSTFITEVGIKPTSAGAGANYNVCGGKTANNNCITNYQITAGTSYTICVDGSSLDPVGMGGINLNVIFVPVPPNDYWASPTTIILQTNVLSGTVPDGTSYYTNFTAHVPSYNIGATTDPGESMLLNTANRTVWFSFVPQQSGYITVSTTNSTFISQTGLRLYSAGEGSSWYVSGIAHNGTGLFTSYINAGNSYMLDVDGTTSDQGYGLFNLDMCLVSSPPNDNFTNATIFAFQTNYSLISLSNGIVTNVAMTAALVGNNFGATAESGESPIGNYSGITSSGRSVWWTFVAPVSGFITLSSTNSLFMTQVGLKLTAAGAGGTWANSIGYSGNGYLTGKSVAAGTSYTLCVDGTTLDAGCGVIDLDVTINPYPTNDNYPGTALSFTTVSNLQTYGGYTITNIAYVATAVGYNAYATSDGYSLGTRTGTYASGGETIWWNFNPPATGNATISLQGSTFDTLLGAGVFTASGQQPYYNDDYIPGIVVQSQVIVPVTAGQTNYVDVDGKTGTSYGSNGAVNLTITIPVPPTNDLYANRTILFPSNGVPVAFGNQTGNVIQVAGSTTQATSSGENFSSYLNAPVNQNVWYSFTPTNTGPVYLSVNSPGSHLIAVYSGTTFNSGWVGGCAGTEGATPNSSFLFTGTSGTSYQICIDGTIPGPFVLNVETFYGAPINQYATNSIAITNNTPTTGSVFNATNNSVWYSFTPACTGQLEVDTQGSSANTVLTAYSAQLNGTYFAFAGNTVNSMGLTVNPISSPTYTNDPSLDPGSVQSLQLNAANSSYLNILDPYAAVSSYSVGVWVKVPVVQAMGIVGLTTTTTGLNSGTWSHDLHITAAGHFEHYTSPSRYVTGNVTIQPNTWYYVVIEAAANGQVALYVNGAQDGTPTTTGSLWMGGNEWQVGAPPPGYNYFTGELGGLAIFHNTILTPAQIASLAASTSSPANYITANSAILSQLSTTPTEYGIAFNVIAGMQYEILVDNTSSNNFVITPHLTCAGYVTADPSAGGFIDAGSTMLSTLSGGTIYCSLNGGNYRPFTNEGQITLTNIQNVTAATNGVITKTGGGYAWNNAGFTSAQSIGSNGFAECVVSSTTGQDSMFGLESIYNSSAYANIDYAIYLCEGTLKLYEAGTQKGASFGTYNIGDRLRVQRNGTVVTYYQNGVLFYTSTIPCNSGPMYFAASLEEQTTCSIGPCYLSTPLVFTSGDANGNVTVSAYTTAGETNTWNYTIQASQPTALRGTFPTWTNGFSSSLALSGGTDGQVLAKSASQGTWQGVFSQQNTTGDCSIDWVDTAVTNSARGAAGLSSSSSFSSFNDITYGIYNNYGVMYIYESGNNRGAFGYSSPGDVFRVERRANTVYYYQNGNLIYTSTVISSGALSATMALFDVGYSIGPAAFYSASSPCISFITNGYGAAVLYTTTAYPGAPPAVNALSPAAIVPTMTAVLGTDYGFANYRSDTISSTQTTECVPGLLPPVFQVTNTTFYTTSPVAVTSPSGVGGLWSIAYPSGTTFVTNAGASMSFTPNGGGLYKASLLAGTQLVSSSTNLYFEVDDLTITPTTNYSSTPFYVYANSSWPMSIYYTYSATGTPNILYTNAIALGATNVTINFMGARTGYTPQFVSGTYIYSPLISITPSGTFNNATTFTINSGGSSGVQYLVTGSAWQTYAAPFVLNGLPSGSGFIQAYMPLGSGEFTSTNTTAVTFQAAAVTANPAAGAVSGNYAVTANTATTNANIYWAVGDNLGNPPSTNSVTNLYAGPISMTGSRTFTFIARETNYQDSVPAAFTYVAQAAAPSFITPTSTNNGPLLITVAAGDTNGGVFRLTDPFNNVQSAAATNGAATFAINAGAAYTLCMTRTGWSQSPSVTNNYYFVMTDLGILPSGNCIYSPVSAYFTASSTNTFPTVYYTTDGSTPTASSTLYTANIPITQSAIITALGLRQGYTSQIITNAYTYMTPVSVTPASGTYSNAFQLVLSNSQATTLYYQINGGAWQVYAGPTTIDGASGGSATLNTRYDSTGCPGPTNLTSYAFQAAAPVIAPASTTIGSGISVSASDATLGASVYYAIGDTNGNAAPSSAITNLYTSPISVTSTRQFLFQAFKTNYINSAQAAETYSSAIPTPWFATPSQTLTNQTAITATSALNSYQSFVLTYPDGSVVTNSVSGGTATFNINEPGICSLQVFDPPWLPSAAATNSYTFQVADLAVNPPGGSFANPLTVTASAGSNPLPLTIYYTTDGTTPTASSLLYTNSLTVTNTTTLQFMGARQGYAPEYVTRQYNYAPGVTVTPGTSTNTQAITITFATNSGSSIAYYRFNGGTWSNYTSPITADGCGSGTLSMDVYAVTGPVCSATNTYVYTFQLAPLAVSPASENLSGPISVSATTATPGASISYAEDLFGNNPTLASATNLYTGAITVTNTACFLFNATKSGYISTQAATIYSGQLPAPAFLTPSQTFSNQAAIGIQSGLAGSGSSWVIVSPSMVTNTVTSPSGTLYWNINASGTYLFQNTKPNWQNSAFVSNSYTFVVQDLSVTPPSGVYNSNLTVTAQSSISDPAPLVVYYTTDGTMPATNSTIYASPLTISTNNTTFIWLATRAGYTPEVTTNIYTYVPPILFAPGAGTYSNAITVALSTAAPGASLFYSFDRANWTNYTGSFTLDGINSGAGTLSAYYTNSMTGMTNSWPLTFVVAPLAVSPSSLTLSGPISVTAGSATTGANIDYSIDPNSLVTTALTNTYTCAITVSTRSFLVFQGFKSGYQNSAQVSEKYIEQLPAPDFLAANNTTFTNVAAVTIEDPRISINTLFDITGPDGEISAEQRSAPDANGWPYAIINLNAGGPYIAYVYGQDWVASGTVTNYYTFIVGDLVTTSNCLFNTPTTSVAAAGSLGGGNPKPLIIYYTLDGSQPSTSSTPYTGPITLTNTTTVTWMGTRGGYVPQYATNLYTYVPPVTATPLPGTNNNAIDITLAVANGQMISYTLDGVDWQNYNNQPIHVDGYGNGMLSLSATYSGGLVSTFTYYFTALAPVVTPAGGLIASNIQVTATDGGTANCFIYYYAGDLGGDPADLGATPTLYMGPIAVTGSYNLVFESTKTGYTDSPLVNMTYIARLPPIQVLTGGGAFTNMVAVSLAGGLSGFGGTYNMINPDRTTTALNSSSPSVSFNANGTGTYTFYMTRAGWIDSPPANWTGSFRVTDLQINPNTPIISDPNYPIVASGDPSNPKSLVIYYTLDGSLPTTGSSLYTAPLTCSTDTTITWLATRSGYSPEYQTNAYHYIPGASLSPTNALFYNAQQFTITGFAAGTVYFRTNYGPWAAYSGPFTIDGESVIDYYASASQAASLTNEFVANFQVAQPVVTPSSQVVSNAIYITASCSTANAAIYYDSGMDANWPSITMATSPTGPVYNGGLTPYTAFIWPPGDVYFNTLTNLYTNSFAFDGQTSRNFVFIGRKPGYYDSAFSNNQYSAILPLPVSTLGTNITISGPTVNTIMSSVPANWNGEPWANNVATVQPTYTKSGAYYYSTWRNAWANSPTLTVTVSYAQPALFTNSLPLQLVQPGTVYTIGRMPDQYEAVGTLANAPTMWYNWAAPATGVATVSVLNNDTGASNAFICAFGQGTAVTNFSTLSSNFLPGAIQVVGGQEYQMGIYQYDPASTNFQVDLSFVPEPANDNWANAYSVQSAVQSGQQITGYTLAATTEAGEPAGTNTVWFQYDCYQAGVLAIYPSGGNISLWQGSSVSNLAQVPAYYTTPMDPRWTDINYYNVAMSMGSQPNPGFNTNGIDFNLTQPGTYYIRRSGPPVVYSDEMEFHLRPINDNFQTPINLPLSSTIGSTAQIQLDTFSYTYTSEGATLQNGEPASPLGPATVWYLWQAPGNGAFSVGATLTPQTFNQDPEALLYPCQIDMYQGNSLSELQPVPSSYTNSLAIVDTKGTPTNISWDTAWPLNGTSANVTEPASGGTWWFTYVSPATGSITIDAGGAWSVESGSRSQDATWIASPTGWGDAGPGSFSAVEGETYHILIPGGDRTFSIFPAGTYSITAQAGQLYYIRLGGTGFRHTITGTFASAPANDNFANAQVIALSPNIYNNGQKASITVNGSLDGAGSEPGENITAADGTVSSHTVWYAVTPTFSGQMTTGTGDAVYNNVYTAVSGSQPSLSSLTAIPTVTFAAVAGQTYYIQVLSAADLPFQLTISLIELPVNDMWTNALPLNISQFYAYNNFATTEPGEPTEPFSLGASVWWGYTPSRNGTLVLSTSPQVASIWEGSDFLSMTMLSTEIPTNDINGNLLMTPIIQNLIVSNQYWISVDSTMGYDMGDGDIQISASYYPVPTNDNFAQATPLTSWTTYPTDNGAFYFFWTSGENYGATAEPQEPAGQTNSIWYTWTAPAKLMVYPSIYSAYMGQGGQWGAAQSYWAPSTSMTANVYRGTSLQNLQPVNSAFFVAQPGEIYYIAVCGPQSSFQLEWNTVLFPSDDMEANAIPFAGSPAALNLYNFGASRESFEQSLFNNSVWGKWNSGTATIMYLGIQQGGPVPLVFPPNTTTNEITIYDSQLNVVTQVELTSIPWSPNIPVITQPVGTNQEYYIAAASSAPGTLLIQVSANPQGQTNITDLSWTRQAIATNSTIWTAPASAQQPTPWFYYLNLPVTGNVMVSDGGGGLASVLADGSAFLVQSGVTNNYTMLMPASANGQDMIGFPNAGSTLVVDVLPPVNDLRANAIPMTLTSSGRNLVTSFTTCNWLANTEGDGMVNSVWYAVYVPTAGVAQIVNNPYPGASVGTTLHWIQTDATSMGSMASANMISDQVCRMSGAYAGVINVNVAQGYYYVVQSDGPGLSTFGVTVTAAPANDNFANATPFTWAISASYSNGETYGASYNVDVNGATVQPGEPPTIGQRTVWYSTTIPNAGQITFNNQDSIYTGDGTMAGLQELFGAGQGTGQLMVAAGENLWVQASGSGTAYITPGPHSMQLIVQPYNDAIANAINITNYVPVTPANWNGQQVYMYTFQAPAGFWTLASDGHYIRNWYCVHATTNLLNVTVSQPDSASGYYDFGAGLGTELQYNQVVYGPGTHFYYPNVWGASPYDINVPQTWDYYEEQLIYSTTGSDPTYRGLFDLTAFPVGAGISYLYAVPQNILFQNVQSVLLANPAQSTAAGPGPCTYTFILAHPDTVWLTPVFPCAAPQSVLLTSQVKSQQVSAYDYLATIESNEVSQPGSYGSTWWSMTMPLTGTLTASATADPSMAGSQAPLLYMWKGTAMTNLQLVSSNFNNSGVVAGQLNAGDPVRISADIGPAGPGLFTLTLTEGPAVLNGTPDQAQYALPYNEVNFDNGNAWDYQQAYSIQLGATNLWYRMLAPGSGWLQRLDADNTTATLYSPVLQDIQLIPPSCSFSGTLTVNVSTEDAIYGPSLIYYTADGSTPTTNSPAYASPFVLTNTTTINLLGIRPGRTPQTCTGTYTYQGSVQCSLASDGSYLAPVTFTLSDDNTNAALVYRLTGDNWMTYTNAVTIDGIGSGSGYVYFSQVVSGQTNTEQFVHLQFTANPPQVNPLDGVFQGSNIAITDNTGETVFYTKLTINQLVTGGYDANAAVPANQTSTGTFTGSLSLAPGNYMFQFQTQKTGYQLSSPITGTYLMQPQPQ